MTWQPISTAPMGKPILLFLNPPLETSDAVGWMPDRELNIVVGWGEVTRYRDGDEAHFTCGICEEGSADTEGHSSPFLMRVSATHWQPLPEPPTV